MHAGPVYAWVHGCPLPRMAGVTASRAAMRVIPWAWVCCVLGIYAIPTHPAFDWPCRGVAERQESGTAIVSFGERKPGSKMDDTYGDNDVRVWLYVSLTPYPLSYGPRGPIGWVRQGKSGPLNFGWAVMAVTDVFLH